MHYTLDYVQVSDESLFIQMTRGNKMAATILFNRYEHLGKQIAGTFIRVECLRGYDTDDFLGIIHDSINKAFRYYQLNQTRFMTFCRNIITQNIAEKIGMIKNELIKQKEVLSLDENDTEQDRGLHEIIADPHQLSMSDYCDINLFLENLSEKSDPNIRIHSKVYILFNLGVSIKEIAKRLNLTLYTVRKYIQETQDGLNGVILRL